MLEGGAQTIPPTLQQSLAARLDRLGKAREVAQVGAVLGREFSHALLMAVADLPDRELGEALEKLDEFESEEGQDGAQHRATYCPASSSFGSGPSSRPESTAASKPSADQSRSD